MATRAKAQRSKRRKAKIEAYLILFFIFLFGFVLGFIMRSFAYAEKPNENEVLSSIECEIVEPCPIKIETEEVTEETETLIETEEETVPEEPVKTYFDIPLSEELQDYIFELCEKEEVPVSLVIALIDHESRFNADAISKTKDYGLMQINACNHEWLKETYGINDILDPKQNILGGVKILGSLCRKYTEPHKILMSYNMGEDGMRKAWKAGRTSTSYSKAVLMLWDSYQFIYETEVKSGTQSN